MSRQWFYMQNGQQQGPVSSEQLKELADKGRITPVNLVWTEGASNWKPASSVRGLFSNTQKSKQVQPPPPPPPFSPTTSPVIPPPIIQSSPPPFAISVERPSVKVRTSPKKKRSLIPHVLLVLFGVPFGMLLIGIMFNDGNYDNDSHNVPVASPNSIIFPNVSQNSATETIPTKASVANTTKSDDSIHSLPSKTVKPTSFPLETSVAITEESTDNYFHRISYISRLPSVGTFAKFAKILPDNKTVVIKGDDKTLVCDAERNAALKNYDNCVGMSDDAQYLILTNPNGSTDIVETITGKIRHRAIIDSEKLRFDNMRQAIISNDGSVLYIPKSSGVILFLASANRVFEINDVDLFALSANENIAAFKKGEQIGIYSCSKSLDSLMRFPLNGFKKVLKIQFSPDGGRLAVLGQVDASPDAANPFTSDEKDVLKIWDTKKRDFIQFSETFNRGDLQFSPNGKMLAVMGEYKSFLWNVDLQKTVLTFADQRGRTPAIAFSPDSSKIALNTRKGFEIWDIGSKKILKEIVPTNMQPNALSYSQDGNFLLLTRSSGSELWDLLALDREERRLARIEAAREHELNSRKDDTNYMKVISASALSKNDLQKANELDYAVVCGNAVEVERVLKKGVHVNSMRFLSNAAMNGKIDTVRLLLKYGADPNCIVSDSGGTVLHMLTTEQYYNDEIFNLLLVYRANINAKDRIGQTPLDYTSDPLIRKYLISKGAKSGRR